MTDLLRAYMQRRIKEIAFLWKNQEGVVVQRVMLDPNFIRPVITPEGRLVELPETAWEYFNGGLHVLSFTQDEIEVVLTPEEEDGSE